MTDADDDLDPFACPRCGATVSERFWGPCQDCRSQLVAAFAAAHDVAGADMAGDGRPATAARFEPAMHVVPNHVATKD